MEDFFDPEIFNIEKNENGYFISTKDGQQCLYLTFKNDAIYVNKLEKCGSNGTILLKLLEEYARSVGIREIELQDASELNTNCVDESGKQIWIKLALLKLLTTGKSWYNSLGYFSSHSNAEEIAGLSCIDAILSSKENKILQIHEIYSIEKLKNKKALYASLNSQSTQFFFLYQKKSANIQYQIDNNETFIASKIDDVNRYTESIIISAQELFPHVDLSLNVREYLLAILPEKFVSHGNCQEYKFISDLLKFIEPLSDYDVFLKKTLSGGKRMCKNTKRFGRRKLKRVSRTTKITDSY